MTSVNRHDDLFTAVDQFQFHQKEPGLFEEIVQEVEMEEGFLPRVWRLLEEETPADIFRKETIFVSILRETFKRILALPEETKMSGQLPPGG